MSFFDIFDVNPQKVVDLLSYFGINVPVGVVTFIVNILCVILLVGIPIGVITACIRWGDKVLTFFSKRRKWRKRYIKEGLEHSFGDYLQSERQKCYIDTQSQGTPPHNYDEPDEAVAGSPRESLVKMFVDRVFKTENTNRHLYIIFAGSGMGKTTFAVQLFISYVRKYTENTLPFPIYILNMVDVKIVENIEALSKRLGNGAHQTILILDALDENLKAAENFDVFRDCLENAIEPFKFVVITCRSQFFADDKSMPETSSIKMTTADKNLLKYNKIYICPFSPDDIDLYIKRKYKGKKRKKAKAIIGKCKHLMARPVLLAHIDDLLDEQESFQTEADIYEVLIEKWIQREVNHIANPDDRMNLMEKLKQFSKLLAVKIYQNWKDIGEFKMSRTQLEEFCRTHHFDTTKYQFRQRSLINHDTAGSYKFSHKSFLEYFLAKELFENPDADISFEGMDMAELFYSGFCRQEYRQLLEAGVMRVEDMGKGEMANRRFTLTVVKKSNYDYRRLKFVTMHGRFVEVVLNWNAYEHNVQDFLQQSGVSTISVINYQKGSTSLRPILDAPNISFVSINGGTLPNSFVKEAEKKGVHVFLNGVKVVDGTKDYENASLDMQLMLQLDRQVRSLQLQSQKENEQRINELIQFAEKINKGKEGTHGVSK